MSFEYKCIGAPERPKRQRGVRGRSERVALAMQEIIAVEAVDGWEYMRTDLVPVEEKASLFSRTREVHRAVLIFRRELNPRPHLVAAETLSAAGRYSADADAIARPPLQPERAAEPRGDARIALSANRASPAPLRTGRDDPPAPARGNRPPPSGLS